MYYLYGVKDGNTLLKSKGRGILWRKYSSGISISSLLYYPTNPSSSLNKYFK